MSRLTLQENLHFSITKTLIGFTAVHSPYNFAPRRLDNLASRPTRRGTRYENNVAFFVSVWPFLESAPPRIIVFNETPMRVCKQIPFEFSAKDASANATFDLAETLATCLFPAEVTTANVATNLAGKFAL